jgi:hypothetical protein
MSQERLTAKNRKRILPPPTDSPGASTARKTLLSAGLLDRDH